MNNFRFLLATLSIVLSLSACQSNQKQVSTTETHIDSTAETHSSLEVSLPRTIDLITLAEEGIFEEGQEVQVAYDGVYFRPKKYEGVPLKKILKTSLEVDHMDKEGILLIFDCKDRYLVSMPLEKALSRPAYVVYRDLDAPDSEDWLPYEKDGKEIFFDPFYLVWEDAPKEDKTFVWPYQLTAIRVIKR